MQLVKIKSKEAELYEYKKHFYKIYQFKKTHMDPL